MNTDNITLDDPTPFPSDWIDPKEKAKKPYSLAYAKAVYSMFVRDQTIIPASRRQDFITNRLYAEGLQDNSKYMKWNSFKNENEQWESYVDLDYTPVSDIPKMIAYPIPTPRQIADIIKKACLILQSPYTWPAS